MLAALCAAVVSGCGLDAVAVPSAAPSVATATPAGEPTVPASPAADREGLQDALDAVAAAFLAADPEAVRPWLDDPSSAFGQRWLDRARNLREVPLSHYRLVLDPSLPDLATEAVRARVGDGAQVAYVVEEHALAGFDEDGPAEEDLFLTVIRRGDAWRIVGDRDAEALGLISVDHLWDHGPVTTVADGPFLALHHPETAASVPTLLAEARAALEDTRSTWPLPWSERVPLIVPRDQDELAELLHVTFDLSEFIAFATATPAGDLAEFRLTGSRILINTETFLSRPSDVRRRIFAHELLHVATRPASGPAVPAWVDEGLAQRLGERRSTTGVELLQAAVSSGRVDGPPLDAQFTTGGQDRIFLSYQLAWSFADYLAERFGEAALAEFYAVLGRGSVGAPGDGDWHVDRAATEVFGHAIDALQAEWIAHLRG